MEIEEGGEGWGNWEMDFFLLKILFICSTEHKQGKQQAEGQHDLSLIILVLITQLK